MAKKKTAAKASKATAKAAKKEKAGQKTERKEKKKQGQEKDADDDDLEAILDQMRREWEEAHNVVEELVEGPPSRRANATLTPCPVGNFLWCIGGEFFSEDNKAHFYNDVFRYAPDKNEWRKFVSLTCPGPRSAHAVVASPAGGGKLYLFGGEFSSLSQNSFHHYRDLWSFDISAHSWDRIDTKVRPSARSGHRMVMWKQYIVLFGGFFDPGMTTRYLNDLWLFDTHYYAWTQIEFKENERRPSPRSGFSFLPATDGVILHGGYCKEYQKGQRPVGIMLEDTWFLKLSLVEADSGPQAQSSKPTVSKHMSTTPVIAKWDRRKLPSTAYKPSLRSGCTMAFWQSKAMGVLFGGVTDEDTGEETMDSVYFNDLYGYQISGNGRWVSLALKAPKKAGGSKSKKAQKPRSTEKDDDSVPEQDHSPSEILEEPMAATKRKELLAMSAADTSVVDPNNPSLTIPMPRYNTMLAVLRNTLFIYGGIFESSRREYTLDDFYTLALDKLDHYVCLKESGIKIPPPEEEQSSSESGSEEDDDHSSDDTEDDATEAHTPIRDEHDSGDLQETENNVENTEAVADLQSALRDEATAFMGVSKDTTRSADDIVSTPQPGEKLDAFYARSREYWASKASDSSDNRGKSLRRDGFGLAEERYAQYKPLLEEVEKILAEAGLDEDEMKQGAAGGQAARMGESRNRR